MKSLKLFIFAALFSFVSVVHANNHHFFAQENAAKTEAPSTKWYGDCQIEVINNSYENVRVYGVLENGARLVPFNIYSFEPPHYISLYYGGYCFAGMTLYIDTFRGENIYTAYTPVNSTVEVFNLYSANQQTDADKSKAPLKVKVTHK